MKQEILEPQFREPSGRGKGRANKGQAFRDLSKGRICSRCKLYKDRDQFFEHPTGLNGLQPRCKECLSILGKTPESKAVKKALYDGRKEAGVCVNCGEPELVNNVHCRKCWFTDKASIQAGGAANLNAIVALWDDQNGRCFYTDELLVPGKNASLDHQDPQSRGGESDPANLRWVSKRINLMKTDMTHNEFIAMCKQIADRFTED